MDDYGRNVNDMPTTPNSYSTLDVFDRMRLGVDGSGNSMSSVNIYQGYTNWNNYYDYKFQQAWGEVINAVTQVYANDIIEELEKLGAEDNNPPPIGDGSSDMTAGTADSSDVALVYAEYLKMPQKYRTLLEQHGLQLVVVRGSMIEYYKELKGVTPRGWPKGKTWDTVPGLARGNVVVIATRGHGTLEGPRVPLTGDGHDLLCFGCLSNAGRASW